MSAHMYMMCACPSAPCNLSPLICLSKKKKCSDTFRHGLRQMHQHAFRRDTACAVRFENFENWLCTQLLERTNKMKNQSVIADPCCSMASKKKKVSVFDA